MPIKVPMLFVVNAAKLTLKNALDSRQFDLVMEKKAD